MNSWYFGNLLPRLDLFCTLHLANIVLVAENNWVCLLLPPWEYKFRPIILNSLMNTPTLLDYNRHYMYIYSLSIYIPFD